MHSCPVNTKVRLGNIKSPQESVPRIEILPFLQKASQMLTYLQLCRSSVLYKYKILDSRAERHVLQRVSWQFNGGFQENGTCVTALCQVFCSVWGRGDYGVELGSAP